MWIYESRKHLVIFLSFFKTDCKNEIFYYLNFFYFFEKLKFFCLNMFLFVYSLSIFVIFLNAQRKM